MYECVSLEKWLDVKGERFWRGRRKAWKAGERKVGV